MSQNNSVLYTGKTHTTGGRDGAAHSDDRRLDIQLAPPGAKAPGTNPEQLFGAGWSACFIGALGKAAQASEVRLPADTAVSAEVDLVHNPESGYFLQARLHVSLPGVEAGQAQALIERAHQTCPYSKATRGNIDVAITLA